MKRICDAAYLPIPICADFAIAVALCRTCLSSQSVSEKTRCHTSYCSIKEVCAPSHSDKLENRLYCSLKDEEKGKNYPRTVSTISSVTLKRFFLLSHCQMPYHSAISLAVLKGLKFRFSPTIFGAFTSAFRMFFVIFA